MKLKVLIWGTGNEYAMYIEEIGILIEEGKIEILALINDKDVKELDGYPVISKDDIKMYQYDHIIIATGEEKERSIRRDMESVGIDQSKVSNIREFVAEYGDPDKYYRQNVNGQIKILQELLDATDEQITDYDWMYGRICEYGIFRFVNDLRQLEDVHWTRYGILQIAEEFTKFCCYLSTLTINTAIELGVAKGRSSYLMCAILQRKNPGLEYNLVDIDDQLDAYEEYLEVLPSMKKIMPSTSEDFKNNVYDFVFIDADHSYNGSMSDWLNLGQYANVLTAFHDVYAHEYDGYDGGIVRTWKEVLELTKGKQYRVFSQYPDRWMGIGCIEHQK